MVPKSGIISFILAFVDALLLRYAPHRNETKRVSFFTASKPNISLCLDTVFMLKKLSNYRDIINLGGFIKSVSFQIQQTIFFKNIKVTLIKQCLNIDEDLFIMYLE